MTACFCTGACSGGRGCPNAGTNITPTPSPWLPNVHPTMPYNPPVSPGYPNPPARAWVNPPLMGWQCPGCKSCYAPSMTKCPDCPQEPKVFINNPPPVNLCDATDHQYDSHIANGEDTSAS